MCALKFTVYRNDVCDWWWAICSDFSQRSRVSYYYWHIRIFTEKYSTFFYIFTFGNFSFIPLNANQPSRSRQSLDESQPQCPFTTQDKQQLQQHQMHQQKQLFSIEPESTRYAQTPKNVPDGLCSVFCHRYIK